MYSARKSVMAKKQNKKKRRLAVSDSSDDKSLDGSTTPQGYTAGVRPIKVATTRMLSVSKV